ncbi:flagellar basal body P-ring formation chaperone FlgA [Pluralibacter gergoviae]|uniref:flagellar basal body P-ring formation chaperone FlgA n=1 Tax=Pluralibacter gergoviae TaxID=61647 RepID=UPI000A3734C0|nr:flagellar basal body P-ring formation chaperone FlgA [Pluralibacter gergoviae]EKT9641549.1 flagellar basal body P-ring formation protein FlgA [Pluralibacter gergoviae]EKV3543943.1 flagellar basal body P-ring formation protein FlgA [Pluralibacter gergoviae]EKV9900209.1 flagellar basal body P-ring formation protein FlgA [Pluralibacter gergoviae]EKV9929810.1 flagellar basal body P-ring formation protein FlgA [Pluralibacter gergoviae]EKW9974199.1 flagellar basal body P-ring formation protein Fl
MNHLTAGFAALMLLSQAAVAQDLQQTLNAFFSQRLAGVADSVDVTLRNPGGALPGCDQPALSVPGSARLWGNLSVQAQCGAERRYLQVSVAATGNYVVAARPIARGSAVTTESVTLRRGRLDQLPPRALLDINQARDAVSLRDVAPGQPIQLSMLRQSWRVKAGQKVMVIASGDGFSASGEGQALNNAAVAQSARVRMGSGQVVSGTVSEDGNILINL